MERAERETIILLNREEMVEGYFTFSTTEAADFRRLCSRIGGADNLVEVSASRDWWECKVPLKYLSRTTWAIGARKSRKLSKAQREALSRPRRNGQQGRKASLPA